MSNALVISNKSDIRGAIDKLLFQRQMYGYYYNVFHDGERKRKKERMESAKKFRLIEITSTKDLSSKI